MCFFLYTKVVGTAYLLRHTRSLNYSLTWEHKIAEHCKDRSARALVGMIHIRECNADALNINPSLNYIINMQFSNQTGSLHP